MLVQILKMGFVTAGVGGLVAAVLTFDREDYMTGLVVGFTCGGLVGLVAATALHSLGAFWGSWMFFAAMSIITGVDCSRKEILEKHQLHLITAAAVLLAAPLLRAVAFRVLFRA